MDRTQISNMNPDQCLDELTMQQLKKNITRARAADKKAKALMLSVFHMLDDMCIDIDAPSAAENAENLGDAVSCYIQYGEFGLANVLKEIRAQYREKEN